MIRLRKTIAASLCLIGFAIALAGLLWPGLILAMLAACYHSGIQDEQEMERLRREERERRTLYVRHETF
ncbi:MAG TPA: hypothetical protein VNK52_16275 [Hyphomicrobiaceae bacterium]|nr:hypothetical protein [Hyphomicrobiaceae bacterium]